MPSEKVERQIYQQGISKMNRLYKESVKNTKDVLLNDYNKVDELSNNLPEQTELHPITEPSPKSKGFAVSSSIGVYRIIYKPTNQVASIGCGNVNCRKARHKGVHKNKGKTMMTKNGAPSPSMTGMHMYKHDKDINNWLFQWTHIGNKPLAEQYEKLLQHKEKPLFNNLSMAGK